MTTIYSKSAMKKDLKMYRRIIILLSIFFTLLINVQAQDSFVMYPDFLRNAENKKWDEWTNCKNAVKITVTSGKIKLDLMDDCFTFNIVDIKIEKSEVIYMTFMGNKAVNIVSTEKAMGTHIWFVFDTKTAIEFLIKKE